MDFELLTGRMTRSKLEDMPKYREQEVADIAEFLSVIEHEKSQAESERNEADFLFRGQQEDLPLLPKIARLKLRGGILNIERLMMQEFRRTSLPYQEFRPENDWDFLALAQHHGLPTRLLDWTFSALVALWFAVKSPADLNKGGDPSGGVVWVLMADVEDFRLDEEERSPFEVKVTKIFRPKTLSRRISAQAGAFTVHGINPSGKVVRFETHMAFSKKLLKIKIPTRVFPEIRRRLNLLGVNASTVFPDLVGLCDHLQWRYSYYSDEKKKPRLVTVYRHKSK